MRTAVILISSLLLLCTGAFASDEDVANRAKFDKECVAMIAPDAPCASVPTGGGGRRGCVSKPENFEKATPACQAVIKEWRAMQKK